jgi:hypothetical protein
MFNSKPEQEKIQVTLKGNTDVLAEQFSLHTGLKTLWFYTPQPRDNFFQLAPKEMLIAYLFIYLWFM